MSQAWQVMNVNHVVRELKSCMLRVPEKPENRFSLESEHCQNQYLGVELRAIAEKGYYLAGCIGIVTNSMSVYFESWGSPANRMLWPKIKFKLQRNFKLFLLYSIQVPFFVIVVIFFKLCGTLISELFIKLF